MAVKYHEEDIKHDTRPSHMILTPYQVLIPISNHSVLSANLGDKRYDFKVFGVTLPGFDLLSPDLLAAAKTIRSVQHGRERIHKIIVIINIRYI